MFLSVSQWTKNLTPTSQNPFDKKYEHSVRISLTRSLCEGEKQSLS